MTKTIGIIYNKDAEGWKPYISKRFTDEVDASLHIFSILDTELMLATSQSELKNSNIIIIILSPGLAQHLTKTDLSFISSTSPMVWDSAPNAKILLLFCGIEAEDLNSTDHQGNLISSRLPSLTENSYFTHENIPLLITHLSSLLQAIPQSKRKTQKRPKTGNGKIKVVPSDAAAEGGTVLTLIIDENLESEENLIINFPTEVNDVWTSVTPVYQTTNVYSVVAPEHTVGKVNVRVCESGKEIGTFALSYVSLYSNIVIGMNQLYSSMIDRILEAVAPKIPVPQLDKALASTFEDIELRRSITAEVFEKIFNVYSSSANEVASTHQLPTPFHLTAKWNLPLLAQQFIDLPDATMALQVKSPQHQTPLQLAKSNNHYQTAEIFETNSNNKEEEFEEIYQTFLQYSDGSELTDTTFAKSLQNKPLTKLSIDTGPKLPPNIPAQRQQTSAKNKYQLELIELMQEVKKNNLSIEDAETRFKELNLREQSSATNKNFATKVNGKHFIKSFFKNKNLNSEFILEKPQIKERIITGSKDQRGSTTSTTSSSSRESTSSVTSGIELDESFPPRIASRANAQKLPKVAEYEAPPPVPARRQNVDVLYLPMNQNIVSQSSYQELQTDNFKKPAQPRKSSEPLINSSAFRKGLPAPPPKSHFNQR